MTMRYVTAILIVAAIVVLVLWGGYDVDNAATAILGIVATLTGIEVGERRQT